MKKGGTNANNYRHGSTIEKYRLLLFDALVEWLASPPSG